MKKVILILSILLLFSCEKKQEVIYYTDSHITSQTQELKILSFNIQIFGRSKASKEDVMSVIIDIMDDYDLIAIQEVRDISGESLDILMDMMPEEYELVAGPREGRSSSKEQAIYLYNDSILDFVEEYNYSDEDDYFERSPFLSIFRTDDERIEFTMINIHISPSQAEEEIKYLGYLTDIFVGVFGENMILVGDLNADGNYFDEDNLQRYFTEYEIVIGNELDTTVAPSDNTYDRIIISQGIKDYFYDSGVLYFESYLGDVEAKSVSDHYPVYIILKY